jgi:hypothetical protein
MIIGSVVLIIIGVVLILFATYTSVSVGAKRLLNVAGALALVIGLVLLILSTTIWNRNDHVPGEAPVTSTVTTTP